MNRVRLSAHLRPNATASVRCTRLVYAAGAAVWIAAVSGCPVGSDDPAPDPECSAVDDTGACSGKAQGEACTADHECVTSHCVDSYCCDSDCSGSCMACRADWTGGTNGICSGIRGGTDPEEECDGGGTCADAGGCTAGAADGQPCDGDGKCASGHCAGRVCCATACDAVCQACVESVTGVADGTCAPILEPFDPDGECLASGGFGCDGAGACNPTKTWGVQPHLENDLGQVCAGPDVAIGAAGHVFAVWSRRIGASDTPCVVRAHRYVPGEGWRSGEAIQTDTTRSSGQPTVAVNSGGDALATWVQTDETGVTMWVSRYLQGSGWQAAEAISTPAAGSVVSHDVALDAAGNAFVVWRHSVGGDDDPIDLLVNRLEVGVGWTGTTQLEDDAAGRVGRQSVAISAANEAWVAWTQSKAMHSNAWLRRYTPVKDWEAPVPLNDAGADATSVSIGTNAAGEAIAIWDEGTDIWARPYSGGTWGAAASTDVGDDRSHRTDVAVAGDGSAVVLWVHEGIHQQIDVWANRFDPNAGWSSAALVEQDINTVVRLDAAVDAAGNAIAFWTRNYDKSGRQLRFNRLVVGRGWGEAAVFDTAPSDSCAVAANPAGNAAVVWMELNDIWSGVLR